MTSLNWVDAALLMLAGLSAWGARRQGCLLTVVGLAGSVGSVVVATVLAIPLAVELGPSLPIPPVWVPPAAFLVLWLGMQSLYLVLARLLIWRRLDPFARSTPNRWFALIPGALRGLVTVGLVLTVLTVAPIPDALLEAIRQSAVANPLVETIRAMERPLDGVFGPAMGQIRDIGREGAAGGDPENQDLSFRVPLPTAAPEAEEQMVEIMNVERRRRGLTPLAVDATLREVARAHAKDLLQQGYFAHMGRDGRSPFDRMHASGIQYTTAGENLALGPTTEDAEAGLIASPSHRANILNPRFARVGVGVMDGGQDGEMFVQEFTN